MKNDLSLMLEVPEETDKKELSGLLKGYGFSAKEEAISLDRDGVNRLIYVIQGSQTSYRQLEEELVKKGYQLWADPQMETFGPVK